MATLEQRVAEFIERLAKGSRLDPEGLNHDDDSVMDLAARIPNAGCAYTSKKLKEIAFTAMALHLELQKNGNKAR